MTKTPTSVRGLAESSEVSKSSAHRARSRELAERLLPSPRPWERPEPPVPEVIGRDGKTYSVSRDAHLWRLSYALSLLSIRKSPEEVADEMGVSVRTVRRWRQRYGALIEEAQRKADAHGGGRGPRNWGPPISRAMVRRALTARPKP